MTKSVSSLVAGVLMSALAAAPAAALEEGFDSPGLPPGWSAAPWSPGGASVVGGGALSVDGTFVAPAALAGPGRALEFTATFSGDAWQHAGFGTDYNGAPWAIFSTFSGGGLYARTSSGAGATDTALPASLLGAPHRFRIDWTEAGVVFRVDGVVVAAHGPVLGEMRPALSDLTPGGGALSVSALEVREAVVRTELGGAALPEGLSATPWAEGGAAVPGAPLLLDGALLDGGAAAEGRSFEIVAAFSGDPWQHVGLGSDFTAAPWIIFSTFSGGGALYARSADASGAFQNTQLPGDWLGAPHRLRIDRGAGDAVFSIDGAVVARHAAAPGGALRLLASDYGVGGGALQLGSIESFTPGLRLALDAAALPAGWTAGAFGEGGGARVGGGLLTVDGALAGTEASFTPGRTLTAVATFSGDPWQHLGLGTDLSGAPWALFSTYGGGGLYARTNSGDGAPIDTPIPGDWLGAPHSFRIEWTEAGVVFSIDGAVVATHETALSAALRPVVSDYQAGGGAVTVDSLSLLP